MSRDYGSLTITLAVGEPLIIGDALVTIVRANGRKWTININAPKEVQVRRVNAKRNKTKDTSTGEAEGLPPKGVVHEATTEDQEGRP